MKLHLEEKEIYIFAFYHPRQYILNQALRFSKNETDWIKTCSFKKSFCENELQTHYQNFVITNTREEL